MAKDAISMLNALSSGQAVNSEPNVQKMMIVAPSSDNCSVPAATVNNHINVGNLKNGGGDVVTFDVTNGDAAARLLIFGLGLLNVTGTPGNFGIANAAVDEPLVTDDFGAATAKMQFFSEFVNGHSYIAKSIKIFNASAAQVATAPQFATITPNGDFRQTRSGNVEQNNDLNYVKLVGCHIPLTFYQGVTYLLGAGETVSVEIEVLGVDMIGDFADGLGSC